jgi:prepilin-type N-terminal cleavage/methylation domain-containing protein
MISHANPIPAFYAPPGRVFFMTLAPAGAYDNRRKGCGMGARKAFTLVELLVVVAIIALLATIIAPSLRRATFMTRLSVCAAHQHAFGSVANLYASDHRQFYPRQDLAGTGRNLWDVSNDFYGLRHDYDMPHEMFFCPTTPRDFVEKRYNHYGWFKLIGYMYWVPRRFGSIIAPPDPGDTNHVVLDTEVFRGPISAVDRHLGANPLLTDVVGIGQGLAQGDLRTVNLARERPPGLTSTSAHQFHGLVELSNQVYGDGHVRTVPGNEIRVRYLGNWWNFR